MKKNTIYKLLCTTILIPSIALGAEDQEKKVPQTPVSKVRAQMATIPKTPDVSTKAKEYDPNVYSPYSANYYAKRDIALISEQNAKQRAELENKAKELEYDRELARIEREEEELRNKLLAERQAELEESERKSKELDQAIESARLREEEAERNLSDLKSQLEYMKSEAERTAQLEAQLESMKAEVEKANTATTLQREQKTKIRESAEAEIERRDQKIKEMEVLVQKRTDELRQTKLERERLRLEKETLQKLQALKISSEGTTEQKSNPSPQRIPNIVPQQKLPDVVTTPQSQDDPLVSGSEQPSGSVGSGENSTTTKKKRVVKNETDTKF